MLSIINDILDFSKIEAGRLDFDEVSFHLQQAVDDVMLTVGHTAAVKNLQINAHLAPDLPPYLLGDAGRLRQILTNLLSNAVKFTQKGSIAIRVTRVDEVAAKILLLFEIEDSGVGIPQKSIGRLFKPFSQADASTSRVFGGTGLGLSISKYLVERMGGTIGVSSTEGKGSTFWFTVRLPLAEKFNHKDEESEQHFASHLGKLGPVRILVAEDLPINQVIASKLLEKMGFSVEIASNGKEAVKAMIERPFDLILMDCHMPEMDGYDATKTIRNHPQIKHRDIPIIAMTANAMKGDREDCLRAGMNDYLSKPIKPNTLGHTISKWLHRSNVLVKTEVAPAAGENAAEVMRQALAELLESTGSEQIVQELIGLLLLDIPRTLETIRRALSLEDWKGLAFAAHALKAGSDSLGARELASSCQQLERLVKSMDTSAIPGAVEEFAKIAESTMSYLKNEDKSPLAKSA